MLLLFIIGRLKKIKKQNNIGENDGWIEVFA